jgi:hypothetical protein
MAIVLQDGNEINSFGNPIVDYGTNKVGLLGQHE